MQKNNGIDIFPEDAWRLKKISGDGNGHIFLATQGSYFYRSSDGGNTWQKATATGLTVTGNPVSMTFDSYTNKLFVTWNGDGVFRSADLGETWERINSDTDYVYSIYAGKADASGTTGMLLTGTYYNGIMKSTDGGDNWVRKSWTYWITDIISGPNDWLFAISTGAPNHIERSKDFGESWETVLSYTQGGDLAYDAATGYVYASNESNYILRGAVAPGDSWGTVQITTDDTEATREVEVLPNSIIIVGTQKSIYRQGPVADTNDPPSTPALTSPANGSSVSGSTIRLYWQRSIDPDSDDVTYILQVAEDSSFTVNLRNFYVDENGNLLAGMLLPLFGLLGWFGRKRGKKYLMAVAMTFLLASTMLTGCEGSGATSVVKIGDENTISYQVTGLEKGKTFYWRVIAVDEHDKQSDPSETRIFVVI